MSQRVHDDPILLELVKNALDAIVDEMAIALMRTAFSTNLKTSMDMSCALCDADGRLIAQGLTLALHLGSIPNSIVHVMAKFEGAIEPGDIFLLNDPFEGGTHLPDFYVFKPIFTRGQCVGWAVSVGHQMDVGGMTPGGNGCDATEIYQEGLRIPPVKLYERGHPVSAMFDLIGANVRVPRLVIGDVRAQVAACLTGEREYLGLIEKYGLDRFVACGTALLDQAERLSRSAIAAMPDGAYHFTDWIDDDGIDSNPLPIAVTITVSGDHMLVDFEGTSPQVRGAINAPLPFTKSAVYACVRHLIGGTPPNNEGYFRPIEVRAPLASMVNPTLPASVAARGLTGFRIANAVFGALAQLAPDRVFACESGGDSGISYGGYDANRNAFVFVEFVFCGWGGRPDRDGVDACSSSVANFANNPVEIVESEYPFQIVAYEFITDSGGAGQFRGGLALLREYRFENDEGTLQLRTDRRHNLPYGLAGGEDGTASQSILYRDGMAQSLPGKSRHTVCAGDVLRHVTAGAGGWGPPMTREPRLVLHDVSEQKISIGYARQHYGVAIDESTMSIDVAQTDKLRRAARQAVGTQP